MKRRTLADCQALATKNAGKCLGSVYVNNKTKLTWQCNEGHVWEAIPNNVQQGSWCLECAGLKKLTLEHCQDMALMKGGICVSDTYLNANTKLIWRCEEKHIWRATPGDIRHGYWCRACSDIKKTKYTGSSRRIAKRLRTRLLDALRAVKANKKCSAPKGLGCTMKEFMEYFEKLFQPGMTWDNHGLYGWHIDHIRPLHSFNWEDRDEQLKAIHYSNLQPLWAKDNLSKGAKLFS